MAFRIIDALPRNAAGRACYLHGGPPHGRAVATVEIDYEGILVICEGCIGELAHLVGWIDPAKATHLEGKVKTLTAANERLIEVAAKHSRLSEALAESGLVVEPA